MITREELYALVWSEPVTTVAKRLGVSGVYVAHVCIALDVPRPPRGWWAKHSAGKEMPAKPALPAPKPGFPQVWGKPADGVAPIGPYYQLARMRRVDTASRTHFLVSRAEMVFRKALPSADGTHLVPRGRYAIDITCSAKLLDSALSLADALFMRLEARGNVVSLAGGHGLIRPDLEEPSDKYRHSWRIRHRLWTPKAPTVAVVDGVPIGLAILEASEEVLMRYVGDGNYAPASTVKKVDGITWTEIQRVPKGVLKVVAYSPLSATPWRSEWVVNRRTSHNQTSGKVVQALEQYASTYRPRNSG